MDGRDFPQQTTTNSVSIFKKPHSIKPNTELLFSSTFDGTIKQNKGNTLSVFENNNFKRNHPQHHTQKQYDNLPYLPSCKTTEEFLEMRNTKKIQNDTHGIVDCKTIIRTSDSLREGSEMVRKEAERTVQRMDVSMEKKTNDTFKSIEECVKTNERWKKELENEMNETATSVVALEDVKIRMEGSLTKCEEAMVVVLSCLKLEIKPNDVHSYLIKEENILKQFERSLRDEIYAVNNNITESKHTRQHISEAVMRMFYATKSNTPWINKASSLVELSQKQRYANQSQIDSLCEFLHDHSKAFSKQWRLTNQHLSFKVHDFSVSGSKLQENLKKVLMESEEVERMREKVKSWMEKENRTKELAGKKTEMKDGVLGMGFDTLKEDPFRAVHRLRKDLMELVDNAGETDLKLREIESTSIALMRLQKSLSHDIIFHKNLLHLCREVVGIRRAFEVGGDVLCLP